MLTERPFKNMFVNTHHLPSLSEHPQQDSDACGSVKGAEITHSGDGSSGTMPALLHVSNHLHGETYCDWLAHYLELEGERSHHQEV